MKLMKLMKKEGGIFVMTASVVNAVLLAPNMGDEGISPVPIIIGVVLVVLLAVLTVVQKKRKNREED